jgi:bacillithiol system protein YtxJ
MPSRFVPVADEGAVRALLAAATPAVLFCHDPACGTSLRAADELARLRRRIHLLDVRRHHGLGQWLAHATGIPHESPQVFVLVAGRVAWHADHGAITTAAVARAWEATAERGP